MGKRGPKGNHFEYKGQTIVGLRRDAKSGRFFPVGRGSPAFGSDPLKAIHRFNVWQARQGEQPKPIIPVKMPSTIEALDATVGYAVQDKPFRKMIPSTWSPGEIETDVESIRWQERNRIRDLIYTNPVKAATELDCEPLALLANVENLQPPQPAIPLTQLCDTYLEDQTLTVREANNSRTWWDEFLAITKATVITDLDLQTFRTYRSTIKKQKENRSNVWVRSRFGKIKTIIKHASDEMELTAKERSILLHRSLLKQPPKPKPKPVDISPEQMNEILSRADKWDKALILLALNAAYTNIDCSRLTWDMVNFQDRSIRFDREKSERLSDAPLPRICALWDRTTKALKAIKNDHTHVFLSTLKTPAHIDTIYDHFKNLCELASVKTRTFKHLKKSALTAASNDETVPDRQINLLAGHSAGIKEHYVVRRNVQLACEAIERYYFGKRS